MHSPPAVPTFISLVCVASADFICWEEKQEPPLSSSLSQKGLAFLVAVFMVIEKRDCSLQGNNIPCFLSQSLGSRSRTLRTPVFKVRHNSRLPGKRHSFFFWDESYFSHAHLHMHTHFIELRAPFCPWTKVIRHQSLPQPGSFGQQICGMLGGTPTGI